MDGLIAADRLLFRWINQKSGHALADQLMRWVSSEELWAGLALLLAASIFWKGSRPARQMFLGLVVVVALADSFSYRILKPFFARSRPCHGLSEVQLVADSCGGPYGFPSNHAANTMGVATLVYLFHRRRWLLVVLLMSVLTVGFSRIYLGVHYPADVVAGYLVGAGCGGLLALALHRLVPNLIARSPAQAVRSREIPSEVAESRGSTRDASADL